MALIERLMGEPFAPQDTKIHIHAFYAATNEVARGVRTLAQIKTYWNMDVVDAAELDLLAALVIGSDTAKLWKLQDFHCVFLLMEERVTFYTTPTEVRTRLGLPIP